MNRARIDKKEDKKRLVLLDAHAILHRAYHALPDFATSKGEPTGALYGLSAMLIKIIEDLKPDYIIACYDLKGPTYRHEVYKEYKSGRKKADEALVAQMTSSREVFKAFNIAIYDKQGFEADDILGTIVEKVKNDKAIDVIIASGDMDTMQLIDDDKVQVYTLKKGIKDTIMYNEEAIIKRFGFGPELIPDYKGLRGDPSDNIVGVKGIGEKTATSLIVKFGTIENLYQELESGHEDKFKDAGISPRLIQVLKDNKEEAEFSKMLATIRRDVPIDFRIPDKTFLQDLDLKKTRALWQELEFRTLGIRLENVVAGIGGGEREDDKQFGEDDMKNEDAIKKEESLISDSESFKKTALALWIINSDTTNPQLEDVLNFANTDSLEKANKYILDELNKRGLNKVYENIELPLIPVLNKMEQKGILVDRKLLQELSTEYQHNVHVLEKDIWKLAGVEFNIDSPKQLGEILFDKLSLTAKNLKKTAGGARSTRESELEKLRDLHPIVPKIFEYRELQKLLSTYIDAIPPLIKDDGRLHTHFIQSGSTTGRMASENPNLQNIPIMTERGRAIRKAFISPEGFVLGSFDYSQIELRIAAFLSRDPKLLEIFRTGQDVHRSVASFVFKVPQDEVSSDMRRKAKVINFGILYGMGVLALKQQLGSSKDEAQKYLNDYFETFSVLADYMDGVKKEVASRGYSETYFGRRRYFQGINSHIPYIKAQAERMAINAPIQGTEADIIKIAMVRINDFIQDKKLNQDVSLILQVHDELLLEIRQNIADEIAPQIQKIMESVIAPEEIEGVKLETSSSLGKSWGEMK